MATISNPGMLFNPVQDRETNPRIRQRLEIIGVDTPSTRRAFYTADEIERIKFRLLVAVICNETSDNPSETLARWRSKIGISQRDLAKAVGLKRSAISLRELYHLRLPLREAKEMVSYLIEEGIWRNSIFIEQVKLSIDPQENGNREAHSILVSSKLAFLSTIISSDDPEKIMGYWQKSLKVSITELAEKIGMPRPNLNNLLRGHLKAPVSTRVVKRFVDGLFEMRRAEIELEFSNPQDSNDLLRMDLTTRGLSV